MGSQTDIPYYKNTFQQEIGKYIISKVASFIDEYQIYFTQTKKTSKKPKAIETKYIQRIKDIDRTINPILNMINRWKDITSYRDNFVAHSNRTGWNFRTLIISSQEAYDAPRQFWEFQLLRDLIHIMSGIISQEFKMELNEAWFIGRTLKAVINPNKDNSRIQLEIQNMVNDFDKISQELGKSYSLNVFDIGNELSQRLTGSYQSFSHPLSLINYHFRTNPPNEIKT